MDALFLLFGSVSGSTAHRAEADGRTRFLEILGMGWKMPDKVQVGVEFIDLQYKVKTEECQATWFG
jgi:hypothetical protein